MITTISVPLLRVDYSRWLNFIMTSRQLMRQYDRQLIQIREQHNDLRELSDYLRACLHERNEFFGELGLLLAHKVGQLRVDPVEESAVRQLTQTHPIMEKLIQQLMETFAEVEAHYQSLFSGGQPSR